jgi:hypothetical protein
LYHGKYYKRKEEKYYSRGGGTIAERYNYYKERGEEEVTFAKYHLTHIIKSHASLQSIPPTPALHNVGPFGGLRRDGALLRL